MSVFFYSSKIAQANSLRLIGSLTVVVPAGK